MNHVFMGVGLARRRLLGRFTAFTLVSALAVVVAVSLLERREDPLVATDRALAGVCFGLAIPLLCWAVVHALSAGRNLLDSLSTLSRNGVNRRRAWCGFALVALSGCAIGSGLLAATAVLATRSVRDSAFLTDLMTTSAIGLVAGTAYALWFAVASMIGARGGGRFWAWVADWVLGSSTTALGLLFPRAHLRNLLGFEPVVDLPQAASYGVMAFLAVTLFSFALFRQSP